MLERFSITKPMQSSLNSPPISNAFIDRLCQFERLNAAAIHALHDLMPVSDWVESGQVILAEGEPSPFVVPILEGLAYRYKQMRDGRRQIIGLLTPGDLSGGYGRLSQRLHYGVMAQTRVRVAKTSCEPFWTLAQREPMIGLALHRAALADEDLLRAWIINLGQRQATARMAHLLCELEHRMSNCGLTLNAGEFRLPLSQQELGEVLGMSSVHINRVLQKLRAEKLITFYSRIVRIKNLEGLRAVADFDSGYLDRVDRF